MGDRADRQLPIITNHYLQIRDKTETFRYQSDNQSKIRLPSVAFSWHTFPVENQVISYYYILVFGDMALSKIKILSICCASVLTLLLLEYTTGIALVVTVPQTFQLTSDKPCVILHYTNFYGSIWMGGATKTGEVS